MTFAGFSSDAFAWFAGLERDNSKAYFTATRERYEVDVRGELEAMLDELAGAFGGEVRVFRQQRDLRFSPDKSPYKTRTYGVISGAGTAGLYAEISARGLYAGTGYHQLMPDQRVALLRHRALVAGRRLAGEDGLGREAALGHVAGTWRAAAPITAWLDAHVGRSALPPRR
jgi:uncharacterized protein (DUF2461 family)